MTFSDRYSNGELRSPYNLTGRDDVVRVDEWAMEHGFKRGKTNVRVAHSWNLAIGEPIKHKRMILTRPSGKGSMYPAPSGTPEWLMTIRVVADGDPEAYMKVLYKYRVEILKYGQDGTPTQIVFKESPEFDIKTLQDIYNGFMGLVRRDGAKEF